MLALLIIVFVILIAFAVGGLTGAPWVPMRSRDIAGVLDDCDLAPGQQLIELGCGDGRLLLAAAKRGYHVIGYEINPWLWLIAYVRSLPQRKRISVRLANFWAISFSSADAIVVFLVPRHMQRLEKKAAREMTPGSTLVSYVFKLPKQPQRKHRRAWYVYSF